MIITVHLSDGRKITKDESKLLFFRVREENTMRSEWEYGQIAVPKVREGFITINMNHIVDMRPADETEKEYAKIHGW